MRKAVGGDGKFPDSIGKNEKRAEKTGQPELSDFPCTQEIGSQRRKVRSSG